MLADYIATILLSRRSQDPGWYFRPTFEEGELANRIAFWVAITCLITSCLVLAWAFAIYCNKRIRHHLDKVSTRMLLVCVAVTLILSMGNAASTIGWREPEKHQLGCAVSMWFTVFSFYFTNWLQGCICLNLIFALYCPNVFKNRIITWYYVSGTIASLLCASIPAALGIFHWNNSYSCWLFAAPVPSAFDAAQLGLVELPLIMITILMFISWGMVAKRLFSKRRAGETTTGLINQLYDPRCPNLDGVDQLHGTERVGVGSRFEITEREWPNELYSSPSKRSQSSLLSPSRLFPGQRSSWRRTWTSPKAPSLTSPQISRSVFSESSFSSSPVVRPGAGLTAIDETPKDAPKVLVAKLPMTYDAIEDMGLEERRQLRNTILRIALYPLLHLLISLLGAVTQIILTNSEGYSRGYQLALFICGFIGCSWLPIAYSMCAVLADDSLLRATYDWWTNAQGRALDNEDIDLELSLGRNAHLAHMNRVLQHEAKLQADQSEEFGDKNQIFSPRGAVILELIEEDDDIKWAVEKPDESKVQLNSPSVPVFSPPLPGMATPQLTTRNSATMVNTLSPVQPSPMASDVSSPRSKLSTPRSVHSDLIKASPHKL